MWYLCLYPPCRYGNCRQSITEALGDNWTVRAALIAWLNANHGEVAWWPRARRGDPLRGGHVGELVDAPALSFVFSYSQHPSPTQRVLRAGRSQRPARVSCPTASCVRNVLHGRSRTSFHMASYPRICVYRCRVRGGTSRVLPGR